MSDLAARIRAEADYWEATGKVAPAVTAAHRKILDLHSSDGGHECAGGKDVWGNVTVFERDCPTVLALAAAYGIDTQEQR